MDNKDAVEVAGTEAVAAAAITQDAASPHLEATTNSQPMTTNNITNNSYSITSII